jgi:glycerate 2-kinase
MAPFYPALRRAYPRRRRCATAPAKFSEVSAERRLLAVPDKFRGTASAGEIAAAIVRAATAAGWSAEALPMSDGGEGLLDCFGGPNRTSEVSGPLGSPVAAAWQLDGERAVIEMAAASGLSLVADRNDPLAAGTAGTGQLIAAAIEAGAAQIIVGAGGSASTDGGRGAVDILRRYGPLDGSRGYQVVVAVDVTTTFLDAARLFAPQKGADSEQVAELTDRLRAVAEDYQAEFGVDVTTRTGSGAAGGLAGGLAALGASIRPGTELVADELHLPSRIGAVDLVITGEGLLDETSALGKAPGAIAQIGAEVGTPVAMVVGDIAPGVEPTVPTLALLREYGRDAAFGDTLGCVESAVAALLAGAGT